MTSRTDWIRIGAGLATLAALVTCAPQDGLEQAPTPVAGQPEIRLGLLVGVASVEVGSDGAFIIRDQDGAVLATPTAARWRIRRDAGEVVADAPGSGVTLRSPLALSFEPASGGGILAVNGRPYRGRVTAIRDRAGVLVVNTVGIEDYLASVVGAEMGRRDSAESEALAAQAIVSRTYALRNLGKRASEGFDLYATVVDQVYGGAATEYPLARDAVVRTASQVVTWQGNLIDAFFFSTCAGRTAEGTEVFVGARRPYLRSMHDTDLAGEPYCRASPRYRWRVEWTAEQLRQVLRETLPTTKGTSAEDAARVDGVTVSRMTPSDRVAQVTITLGQTRVTVDGPAVRQTLHPVGEVALRSAVFRLTERRAGRSLAGLVAEGSGAGHGVGFCQWGAVGRARAGQDAPAILAAYFPGTSISRAY